MAIYMLSVRRISKAPSKGVGPGHVNAGAYAKYISRADSHELTHDQAGRYADYTTRGGQWSERGDLVASGSAYLPHFTSDGVTFFAQAQRLSAVNGHLAMEVQIALPRELNSEQNVALAQAFAETIADRKHPVLWAVHRPDTYTDGLPHPHAHILISKKYDDGVERSVEQYFRHHYSSQEPSHTGAPSDHDIDRKQRLYAWRQEWERTCNVALERHGHDARIEASRQYAYAAPARLNHRDYAQLRQTVNDIETRDLTSQGVSERDIESRRLTYWGDPATLSPDHMHQIAETQGLSNEQRTWLVERRDRALVQRIERDEHRDIHGAEHTMTYRDYARLGEAGVSEAYMDKLRARAGSHEPELTRADVEGEFATLDHVEERIRQDYRYERQFERREERGLLECEYPRDMPIIGNRDSGIYHVPGQKHYGDVAPRNQDRFVTERAAIEAGYRIARNEFNVGVGDPMEAIHYERLHGRRPEPSVDRWGSVDLAQLMPDEDDAVDSATPRRRRRRRGLGRGDEGIER